MTESADSANDGGPSAFNSLPCRYLEFDELRKLRYSGAFRAIAPIGAGHSVDAIQALLLELPNGTIVSLILDVDADQPGWQKIYDSRTTDDDDPYRTGFKLLLEECVDDPSRAEIPDLEEWRNATGGESA